MWKVTLFLVFKQSEDKTQHEKLPYLSHKWLLFTLVQCYIYNDNNLLAIVTSGWTQDKMTTTTPQTTNCIPKPTQKTMRKQTQSLITMMIGRKGYLNPTKYQVCNVKDLKTWISQKLKLYPSSRLFSSLSDSPHSTLSYHFLWFPTWANPPELICTKKHSVPLCWLLPGQLMLHNDVLAQDLSTGFHCGPLRVFGVPW